MDLILFLSSGKTFRFEGVKNFLVIGDTVSFDYFGVSTQMRRTAKFIGVAGYSTEMPKIEGGPNK